MTDPSTVDFNAIPYLVGRFSEGKGYQWIQRKPIDDQHVPHQSKPLFILHVANKELKTRVYKRKREDYTNMKLEDINKDFIHFPPLKRNKRKN